jgi:hypothetical protein
MIARRNLSRGALAGVRSGSPSRSGGTVLFRPCCASYSAKDNKIPRKSGAAHDAGRSGPTAIRSQVSSHAKLGYWRLFRSSWESIQQEMPSMSFRWILAVVVGAVAIALVAIRGPYSGVQDVAHEAVRLHLNLIGSSIYEYHAATGKWPTQIDDLERRSWFVNDAMVIVWHKDLKPDPKDNARQILAYHDKGLIAEGGHKWVCWGDLRTEYIKTVDLQAYLKKLKD